MRIAFITWDGPEQNYLESLFFPIFHQSARHGVRFSVLHFTWGSRTLPDSIRRAALALNIEYEHRRVLRKPLTAATAAMIAHGAGEVVRHVRRHRADLVMPRSLIPAAMSLLARGRLGDVSMVFDADGFMADERVEFGGWDPSGFPYRIFRDVEAEACRRAAAVVTRTHRAKVMLLERAGARMDGSKIHVIPNGRDPSLFIPLSGSQREAVRARHGIDPNSPWILYVGSLGPQYHPRKTIDFFHSLHRRRSDARLTILTGQEREAHQLLSASGLQASAVKVQRVPPGEISEYMGAADLGLALREPSLSQRGVSPIKVAEYLLSGLPVLANRGVGDLDSQLDDRTGLIVDNLRTFDPDKAAERFLTTVMTSRDEHRTACRQTGLEHFALKHCGRRLAHALSAAHRKERKPSHSATLD